MWTVIVMSIISVFRHVGTCKGNNTQEEYITQKTLHPVTYLESNHILLTVVWPGQKTSYCNSYKIIEVVLCNIIWLQQKNSLLSCFTILWMKIWSLIPIIIIKIITNNGKSLKSIVITIKSRSMFVPRILNLLNKSINYIT